MIKTFPGVNHVLSMHQKALWAQNTHSAALADTIFEDGAHTAGVTAVV